MTVRSATTAAFLILALFASTAALGQEAYFAVARPGDYEAGTSDAYTLPLTDPADILLARQLVGSGGGNLIAVAYVVKGADGINRDWGAPGNPAWSWHVVEFLGFAEATIELCDGNPTFTEAESSSWADGDKIQICYWSYRVMEEVTALPVARRSWSRVKSRF